MQSQDGSSDSVDLINWRLNRTIGEGRSIF